MASARRYTWSPLDTIWHVCSRYLAESGWADTPDFVAQVIAANAVDQPHAPGADPALWAALWDWGNVAPGRSIIMPYAA
jgi:hypothetical protein